MPGSLTVKLFDVKHSRNVLTFKTTNSANWLLIITTLADFRYWNRQPHFKSLCATLDTIY